ncbi:MAG: hypothetical protein QNJ85_15415 [Gammaproteobacteria bacterium]|nr:hypothetical protein [Gammaproteobacteria bacterium]
MITANPVNLPLVPERPTTRRVDVVAEGRLRDAGQQRQQYVYRGELLDGAPPQRRYRPQTNLQVDPQNQRAINAYLDVAREPPLVGQLLDGMI